MEKTEHLPRADGSVGPESDATQVMAAAPSRRIGPYEVLSLLGKGGMGEVHLATDSRLGRKVALKLLAPEMAGQTDARARFLREARSAAALHHPNIATIFDTGEANEHIYLAMEYIDGQPLRSMLKAGPLRESEVMELASQLASALEQAHSRGILHRDIKPENVMVDSTGAAKLVDFGIAKSLTSQPEDSAELTTPGMFVGTLKYAPPEVLAGYPASGQSDLYSLGITLYEALCGQSPFAGFSATAVAGAILQGKRVPLREMNAAISQGMADTIERCMSLAPEDRFANATEMLAAIRAVRDSGGVSGGVQGSPKTTLLAILEFANVSRDPSMDWLGGGIVETIESELRKLQTVQVASRARSQQVIQALRLNIHEPAGLTSLGMRLAAKWVVTGSFQRIGKRLRVITSVLHIPDGKNVYPEKVDGDWDDLFDIQDRVLAELTRSLGLETSHCMASQERNDAAPSLDAYEHYANGRQCLNQMGREGLVQAKQHFERAIALNPNYGLAYSGLGTANALSCIHAPSLAAFESAELNLERAIGLDPELGEPYPWLCYLYARKGELDKSLKAGERGVQLQPDLAIAHYFHSLAIFTAVEFGAASYRQALDGLMTALALEPYMGAAFMVAGAAALQTGHYAAAQRFLEGAVRVDGMPQARFRFVGGRTMLGFVHTRQSLWTSARRHHEESMEGLRSSDHVYRDVFVTLSACGLGEIELRTGRPEQALTHFRHAWRIVQEQPKMIGNLRLGIRSQAGMAGAYAASGERGKAELHLGEASSRVASAKFGTWTFDTHLAQLCHSIASAQLRLGMAQEALASLSRAVDVGFVDHHWLDTDPEWRSLRATEAFGQIMERVKLIPAVGIDLGRIPTHEGNTSTSGIVPPPK